MTGETPQRLLRTPDAALLLGLSARTLEKHRCFGTGPVYRKLGGRIERAYTRANLLPFDMVDNVAEVFQSWRGGTVIRSWLLDLISDALAEDEHLDSLRGYADDSGEGRWTVEAAIDNAVPMNVIAASLFARFTSRQDDSPAMKAIAAMRKGFGGHAVKSSDS